MTEFAYKKTKPVAKKATTPIISAIALVPTYGGFQGLRCIKGRGIILPGGKWERGESYHDTALRELREELGITSHNAEYLWHGIDCDGFTCYAFLIRDTQGVPTSLGSGIPEVATWDDLIESYYGAYYQVLRDVCRGHHRAEFQALARIQ